MEQLIQVLDMQFFLEHILYFGGLLGCFAFLGIGSELLSGRVLARERKRSSYDKCAFQLLWIGLGIGWLLMVAMKAWLVMDHGFTLPKDMHASFLEILWSFLAIATLFLTNYAFVWKRVAKKNLLQSILSGICLGFGSFAVLLFLAYTRLVSLSPLTDLPNLSALSALLIPPFHSEAFFALLLFLPFFFLLPLSFGTMGLLVVRSHFDYGRDHYNIAFQWLCGVAKIWAGIVLLLLVGRMGLLFWQTREAPDITAFIPYGILSLCMLLATGVFACVSKSTLPLRHKLVLVIADLLSIFVFLRIVHIWLH